LADSLEKIDIDHANHIINETVKINFGNTKDRMTLIKRHINLNQKDYETLKMYLDNLYNEKDGDIFIKKVNELISLTDQFDLIEAQKDNLKESFSILKYSGHLWKN
jgi:hypothetical protein